MRYSLSILVAVLITLAACQRVLAQVTRLPSGHEVRVVQIGTIFFSADKPPLMIKYETRSSFADVPTLRNEAKELAEMLRGTLDGSGHDAAILSANEPTGSAIISKTRGYNFIVEKQSDGTWKVKE